MWESSLGLSCHSTHARKRLPFSSDIANNYSRKHLLCKSTQSLTRTSPDSNRRICKQFHNPPQAYQQSLRLGPPVTGSAGPSGPKMPKKSQKGLSGPGSLKCQKVPKKSRKSRKSLSLALFRVVTFSTFSALFLALRADRPGETFLRLFWHFGPGGPGTPCNWSLQSQNNRAFLCTSLM